MKPLILIMVVVAAVASLIIQQKSLNSVREELVAVRKQLSEVEDLATRRSRPAAGASSTLLARDPASASAASAYPPYSPQVEERLIALEAIIADLESNARYLMERGQLPPDAAFLVEMRAKLADPNSTDRDRLNALRILRRGNGLDDASLQFTAGWMQSVTDERVREELLRNLDGMTNAVFKAPFMQLASQSTDSRVRAQAVQNLGRFVDDPSVDALLWDIMRNDPEQRVRDSAMSTLRRGPYTETRVASLSQRAMDAQAPLDERLLAARALRYSNTQVPQVMQSLALMAMPGQDNKTRLKVLEAFDGTSDPTFAPVFVQGLQDPDKDIRRQAADSLSGLKSDPGVAQWLQYVAQNDPDPRVRQEAAQALQGRPTPNTSQRR